MVTLGSFQEIDQVDAWRRPVASMLATYPPIHALVVFQVALIAGSPDGAEGAGLAVGAGVAVGVGVGVGVAVGRVRGWPEQ